MDSFNICNIRLEKANAIKKHRQLQKIANLFRFMEICVVLALVSRFSIQQLPVAVKNYSDYFKDLTVVLASPRFVFVVGNAIVITLFAKSGQFSGHGKKPRNDFYEEYVQKSETSRVMHRYAAENREKQSISVVAEKACATLKIKNYQRNLSEKLQQANHNQSGRELRRVESEKNRESVESREGWMKISYPEDSMSNEEFRSTVEAFIARQKRIRRDEENSV